MGVVTVQAARTHQVRLGVSEESTATHLLEPIEGPLGVGGEKLPSLLCERVLENFPVLFCAPRKRIGTVETGLGASLVFADPLPENHAECRRQGNGVLFVLVVVSDLNTLFPCGQDDLGGVDGAELLDGLAVEGGVLKCDGFDQVLCDLGHVECDGRHAAHTQDQYPKDRVPVEQAGDANSPIPLLGRHCFSFHDSANLGSSQSPNPTIE